MTEENKKVFVSKCPNCGNAIQVKTDAVQVYCLVCQNWLNIDKDKLVLQDGNGSTQA